MTRRSLFTALLAPLFAPLLALSRKWIYVGPRTIWESDLELEPVMENDQGEIVGISYSEDKLYSAVMRRLGNA